MYSKLNPFDLDSERTRALELEKDGVIRWPVDIISDFIPFLNEQFNRIQSQKGKSRPWHYWELHNPWSTSSTIVDSWGFLDLCQSHNLLERLGKLIGPDIILFDSRLMAYPRDTQTKKDVFCSDQVFFPVHPLEGVTVRIPLSERNEERPIFIWKAGPSPPDQKSGTHYFSITGAEIIVHDARIRYRIESKTEIPENYEYIIRYFPATSGFIREASSKEQEQLTEVFPLMNYAKIPLWLVQGTDRAKNDFVTGFSTKPGRWI